MRNRRAAQEQVAEVARRRLELLSAELAGISRSLPSPEPPPEPLPEPLGSPPDPTPASPQDPSAGRNLSEDHRPGRHAHRSLSTSARLGGWVRDRLPPTLQGTVGLSSAHVTVVAVLVAGALALTTWWVLRAEADPVVLAPAVAPADELGAAAVAEPVGAGPGAVAGELPGTATAAPAAGQPATVVVDVAGKVREPGIVVLPAGSRVVDAVEAAGGARRGVDLTTVNLARVLVDGEQIVVGIPPPAGVAAPAASAPVGSTGQAGLLVNLNSATQVELEELPGVGPVTAQAILQWRSDHGAFTAVDELLEVSGIGEATLAELAPFVTL